MSLTKNDLSYVAEENAEEADDALQGMGANLDANLELAEEDGRDFLGEEMGTAYMYISPQYGTESGLSVTFGVEVDYNPINGGSMYSSGGGYIHTFQIDEAIMSFLATCEERNIPRRNIDVRWRDDARERYKRLHRHPVRVIKDEPMDVLVNMLKDPYIFDPRYYFRSIEYELRVEGIRNGLIARGATEEDADAMVERHRRIGIRKLKRYWMNSREWYRRQNLQTFNHLFEVLSNGDAKAKLSAIGRSEGWNSNDVDHFFTWIGHAETNQDTLKLICDLLDDPFKRSDFHMTLKSRIQDLVDGLDVERLKIEAKQAKKRKKTESTIENTNWGKLFKNIKL